MASNSLLECLVVASTAVESITDLLRSATNEHVEIAPWDASQVVEGNEDVIISHSWDEIRRVMWDYVGIVRTNKRLERAQLRMDILKGEINEFYSSFRVSKNLIELRNLVLIAELIIQSAKIRQESRGLHYTLDYPKADDINFLSDTIL
jgi:L-aspartate oxidase